jgi:hypothetical protein
MEGNTLLLSPVSYKTPLIFALVRSVGDGRQTEWLNFVRGFTYTRLNRLTGGNLPRRVSLSLTLMRPRLIIIGSADQYTIHHVLPWFPRLRLPLPHFGRG